MKRLLFALTCCTLLVLSSCTTLTKTATTADVQTGIYQYPTVADLDVKSKVESTKTWSFRPFHLGEPSLSLAKGNLIAETLKEQDADVILEPQFIFTRTSYGERRLTLTGFPAKFKNFRRASASDLEALKTNAQPNERTHYNVAKRNILNFFKK